MRVPTLTRVTPTPGSTAPVVSWTTPDTWAVSNCARADAATSRITHAATTARQFMVPPFLEERGQSSGRPPGWPSYSNREAPGQVFIPGVSIPIVALVSTPGRRIYFSFTHNGPAPVRGGMMERTVGRRTVAAAGWSAAVAIALLLGSWQPRT